MNKLKLIFAGTPDFAARHLAALLSSDHEVVAVYTQPDKPAGRGQKLTASPVKELALAHNLPVYQPASLRKEEAQAELAALGAKRRAGQPVIEPEQRGRRARVVLVRVTIG